ncbi:glutamate--cysteine ligase [Blastococcus sp. DSM 46786]|uniref:ergothioneine biosynthesis glutamate--cysteine ligase EgtA n=1 Tax=Blastococcus sp. DSM 46786 TaxID=1798227 RepID=UPI0008C1BC85|nr:ergothioneine biosynthesis glutamate--cysteine ligase EgtA [Blastococcus sp. DSM 46786]SEK68456.1 glutamate--cysteine ligase [Blastococcus sp. DSM 46786]
MTRLTAVPAAPDVVLDVGQVTERITRTALSPGPTGRVGLELEALLVERTDPGRRVPWDRVTDVLAGAGPLPGGSRITLEPGGQIELSGPPAGDVTAAVTALRADRAVLAGALAADGLELAVLGSDPLRLPHRLSPAHRYAAMQEHFAAAGCAGAGLSMMTGTASLQVNLDAGPADGWAARVALAHQLGPVLVAVSACSPVAAGRPGGWRSCRQRIWGDLDQARCGPVLTGEDPAREWAAYALAAPVMLVRDPTTGRAEPVRTRTSLGDWVAGTVPLGGRRPTWDDVDYHLTTLFPPVRPRGYLEIRYLDAAPEPWWPALAAVTATLLDDPVAAGRAAVASAPVAGRWSDAACLGLADAALRTAAVGCLSAALDAVPQALRDDVAALLALVERGRSPGDAVLAAAGSADPIALLRAATDLPEASR